MAKGNRGCRAIENIKRKMIVSKVVGVDGMTDTDNSSVMNENPDAVKLGAWVQCSGYIWHDLHHPGIISGQIRTVC